MRCRRPSTWFVIVWTLTMGAWLVLYQQTHATCGPEIQRNCSIGLSVTAGLGRPGIVLLWFLGMAAFALTWLTNRRVRSRSAQRPPKAGGPPLVGVVTLTVILGATIAVALPASPRPSRERPGAAAVDVRVVSAILHPSASSAGRRRHAARLSVHVLVHNRGGPRVALPDPTVLSGGAALTYDRRQFELDSLRPGEIVDATLRFEPRSAFTQRLVAERDAQLQIAGKTIALPLKIGAPVRKSPLRGVSRAPAAGRATTRRAAVARTPAPAARRAPPPRVAPRTGPPPPAPPPRATPPPPQRRPAIKKTEPSGPIFDDSG